jgi:predicted DNA binding protein
MRRLIVESGIEEIGKHLGLGASLNKIESFEILNFLREEPNEIAIICKIKFKDTATKLQDVLSDHSAIIQHLEKQKDGGHIYYIKRKPLTAIAASDLLASGGFISAPFEIKDGYFRVSYLGTSQEIKRFIGFLNKTHLEYRIISLTDARFSPSSPLSSLTGKQRRVLLAAFKRGYYDIPKKVSSDQLAKSLHIREPTLVRHRIKAEKRLIAAVLAEP